MDGWGGWVGKWRVVSVGGWMDDAWMGGWMDGRKHEWMDEWRWIDGWMMEDN